MRKKIILLALIAGMVILTIFSLLIAKEIEKNKRQEKRIIKYKQKIVKPINQEEPENSQTKEEPKGFQDKQKQTEDIDISDWKTYQSSQHKLQLQYPPDWIVKEFTDTILFEYYDENFHPNSASRLILLRIEDNFKALNTVDFIEKVVVTRNMPNKYCGDSFNIDSGAVVNLNGIIALKFSSYCFSDALLYFTNNKKAYVVTSINSARVFDRLILTILDGGENGY